jgi:uncharacterized lipoprotein
MRTFLFATMVGLAGCASSQQLSQQANTHMENARGAAATGNPEMARAEERKSEHDYQRAVARARDEDRPTPPPPEDPLLQR